MRIIIYAIMFVFLCWGTSWAQENNSNTLQEGELNDALINQTGGRQDARVTQGERLNLAIINQHTESQGPQSAVVNQEGNANEANIVQDMAGGGSSYLNEATISQVGKSNLAYQQQNTRGDQGGHHAMADQHGNSNISDQQSFGGYSINQAVMQNGRMNQAFQVTEGGWETKAEIDIHGHENYATQYQQGTLHEGNIIQRGKGNYAEQMQYGGGILPNQALVDQHGHTNWASVMQDGMNNQALVIQDGRPEGAGDGQHGSGGQGGGCSGDQH